MGEHHDPTQGSQQAASRQPRPALPRPRPRPQLPAPSPCALALLLAKPHHLLQQAHAQVGALVLRVQLQRLLVVRLGKDQVAQLEEAIWGPGGGG